MPFVLALLAIAAAALVLLLRARHAAGTGGDLLDMANDVRNAARRLGFRRQANLHPAESVENPGIAIAGIASGFLELDDLPTSNQRAALVRAMRETLALPAQDADELAILGRWLAAECGSGQAAIARLSRKLVRLSGRESLAPLLSILNSTLAAEGAALNPKQKEALEDLQRAFRIT